MSKEFTIDLTSSEYPLLDCENEKKILLISTVKSNDVHEQRMESNSAVT